MKYKIFQYAIPVGDQIEELNRFLASYRITSIQKYMVSRNACPTMVFVVEFLDKPNGNDSPEQRSFKVDYRKLLTPEQFEVYTRLRDLRKSIADQEGVAAFTDLTNLFVTSLAFKQDELSRRN